MSKSCIICYRVNHFYTPTPLTFDEDCKDGCGVDDTRSRPPGPTSREQETLRRFFKLLARYLDPDKPEEGGDAFLTPTSFGFGESLVLGSPLLEQVLDAGVLSCGDCMKVVESFCKLYHKMKSAQLMLNWRLWTLKGIMSSAERVPARIKDFRESANQLEMMGELGDGEMGDAIIDFKKDLVRKCKAKLRNSFPQVVLSREMAEFEPIKEDSPVVGNTIRPVNLDLEKQKPMWKRGRKRKHQPEMTGRSKMLSNAVEGQLALTAKKITTKVKVPTSPVPIKKRKRGRPRKNLPKLVLIGKPSKRLLKASWIKRGVVGGKSARKEKVPAVKEPDIECEIDADFHLEDKQLPLLSIAAGENHTSEEMDIIPNGDMEAVNVPKQKRGIPRKSKSLSKLTGRPSKRLLKASLLKRAIAGGKAAGDEKDPAVKEPEADADLHPENDGTFSPIIAEAERPTSEEMDSIPYIDMEAVNHNDITCLQWVKIESEEALNPDDHGSADSIQDFVPSPMSPSNVIDSEPTGGFEHEEDHDHPHRRTLDADRPLPESGSMEAEDHSSDSEYLPDPSSEDEDVGEAGGSDDSEFDYYNDADGDPAVTQQDKEANSNPKIAHKKNRKKRMSGHFNMKASSSTSKEKYRCNFEACPTPHRDYSNQEELEIHLKLHGEFNCSFCHMSHSFAPDLALHEVTEHSSKGASVEGGKSSKEVFRCPRPDCRYVVEGHKSFFIQHHLKVHMKLSPYRKPISCDVCNMTLGHLFACQGPYPSAEKRYLRNHYNGHHNLDNLKPGASLQKCDQKDCPAYFLTTSQLEIHKVRIHKIRNWFPCGDCHKRFTRYRSLAEHRANTHLSKEELVHHCTAPGCARRFETERQLKNHVTFNHSEKKTDEICSKCGKSYKGKAALISHMRLHDEEAKAKRPPKVKPVCEVCGKVFKDKGKLTTHLNTTHSSPESWTVLCTLCPKKCMNKQRLAVHMRMHTQEKPFVCDLCGLKYAHRHNLKIHMKASHPGVTLEPRGRGRRHPQRNPDVELSNQEDQLQS